MPLGGRGPGPGAQLRGRRPGDAAGVPAELLPPDGPGGVHALGLRALPPARAPGGLRCPRGAAGAGDRCGPHTVGGPRAPHRTPPDPPADGRLRRHRPRILRWLVRARAHGRRRQRPGVRRPLGQSAGTDGGGRRLLRHAEPTGVPLRDALRVRAHAPQRELPRGGPGHGRPVRLPRVPRGQRLRLPPALRLPTPCRPEGARGRCPGPASRAGRGEGERGPEGGGRLVSGVAAPRGAGRGEGEHGAGGGGRLVSGVAAPRGPGAAGGPAPPRRGGPPGGRAAAAPPGPRGGRGQPAGAGRGSAGRGREDPVRVQRARRPRRGHCRRVQG
mmetsp:Transcript_82105/g.232743  ORF Transcript_82105/g.232743 Transcript_82105/m.232743 type:complete len:329 (+) Transcript_82105:271-1257(+)